MSDHPHPDLVIAFRAASPHSLSKQQTRDEATKAEAQYTRLIETLTYAGLKAVGRRGEQLGHLLVFVSCSNEGVVSLIRRERTSDFLSGLPVAPLSLSAASTIPISPADRIRLVYTYITASPVDGGLGISPESKDWDLIESLTPLHDREFDKAWVKSWTLKNILTAKVNPERLREQFGDAVAYYFAFLSTYTRFLIFPFVLSILSLPPIGLVTPYSPVYSILLCIWSVFFTEYWRIHERRLSLRFGTRGSFRVEKQRAQYKPGSTWYARELKILLSVPVILLAAGILALMLTGIFILEAFVMQLYTGPLKQVVSLLPTVLFMLLIPRFMAFYTGVAERLTKWENHRHMSSYSASLTLKTFALSTLVSYLALALSAFVYVPFGAGVMECVRAWVVKGVGEAQGVKGRGHGEKSHLFDVKLEEDPRTKLNPRRLRDQMFAYTVTNQAVNTFMEIGLPYVMRFVQKKSSSSSNGKKKVVFEDEKERGGEVERVFLEKVREEIALPEYNLFADYSEMVIQFGYVVLWSGIWPLAGAMALLNNILELRSDAFKLTVHNRRPIPMRTDTIGPWLDALTFLTWLGALTNTALVYLFSPTVLSWSHISSSILSAPTDGSTLLAEEHLVNASGAAGDAQWGVDGSNPLTYPATRDLLLRAFLLALAASHAYFVARAVVRHVLDRVVWRASREVEEREGEERRVRSRFLGGAAEESELGLKMEKVMGEDGDGMGFWEHDEGVQEIRRIVKEA
ncbi:calcium-activated chloride channel-domain-containing protein [Cyathus striatus]|nr:calcium-activated chloride channel-domain-containing protein [Cyathus striatus]